MLGVGAASSQCRFFFYLELALTALLWFLSIFFSCTISQEHTHTRMDQGGARKLCPGSLLLGEHTCYIFSAGPLGSSFINSVHIYTRTHAQPSHHARPLTMISRNSPLTTNSTHALHRPSHLTQPTLAHALTN